MPIASFLVSCSDENIEQIAIYLKSKPQYEVLGIENNNIAVSETMLSKMLTVRMFKHQNVLTIQRSVCSAFQTK